MAMPFKPLSTEKLRIYFKKMIKRNCNNKETNQNRKNASGKISRIKLRNSGKILEAWPQKEINS